AAPRAGDDGRGWSIAASHTALPPERGNARARGWPTACRRARVVIGGDARGNAPARIRSPARPPGRSVAIPRRAGRWSTRRGPARDSRGFASRASAATRRHPARAVTDPRVLIVEDDMELSELLARGLREEG